MTARSLLARRSQAAVQWPAGGDLAANHPNPLLAPGALILRGYSGFAARPVVWLKVA